MLRPKLAHMQLARRPAGTKRSGTDAAQTEWPRCFGADETRKSKVYSGCALLTTELQYQTTFEKGSTKGIRLDVWAGDDKGTLRTFAVA